MIDKIYIFGRPEDEVRTYEIITPYVEDGELLAHRMEFTHDDLFNQNGYDGEHKEFEVVYAMAEFLSGEEVKRMEVNEALSFRSCRDTPEMGISWLVRTS